MSEETGMNTIAVTDRGKGRRWRLFGVSESLVSSAEALNLSGFGYLALSLCSLFLNCVLAALSALTVFCCAKSFGPLSLLHQVS